MRIGLIVLKARCSAVPACPNVLTELVPRSSISISLRILLLHKPFSLQKAGVATNQLGP
jgi:hypothetical protein